MDLKEKKKCILNCNHSIILGGNSVKKVTGTGKCWKLIWPETRVTREIGRWKQNGRLKAEARRLEPHMTGVQEFMPFSADKWEPLDSLKQKVPNT